MQDMLSSPGRMSYRMLNAADCVAHSQQTALLVSFMRQLMSTFYPFILLGIRPGSSLENLTFKLDPLSEYQHATGRVRAAGSGSEVSGISPRPANGHGRR